MCDCARDETWATIPGQPGYEVSDHGNVRSFKSGRPRPIKQQANLRRGSYRQFGTSQGARRQYIVKTHVAVAAAFLGDRPEGLEIRHLDGDVANNHLSNLIYGTHLENEQDKFRHGTRVRHRDAACRHGHLYDDANTRWSNGARYCRACQRDAYARNAPENARKARERRALLRAMTTA